MHADEQQGLLTQDMHNSNVNMVVLHGRKQLASLSGDDAPR